MDILKAMGVFVAVVDTGSLTAAAAKSGLSPTMVGNHLQALEQRLGARLVNRTTRRQSLTVFGKTYYERCVEILGLVSDAEALAQDTQSEPKGRLRITASAIFGAERLLPALADYAALYPKVDLDVVASDTMIDLVEEGFEAAIRVGAAHDLRRTDLVVRPLAPYRLAICAAPDYLASRGTPLLPQDLTAHDCLTYIYSSRPDGSAAQSVWYLEGSDGGISVPIAGRLRVDSAQGLRRAALAGMGIGMLPEILVSEDMKAGRLVRVLPAYQPQARPLNLIYLRDRRMSSKLKSFIDFAIMRFGPGTSFAG